MEIIGNRCACPCEVYDLFGHQNIESLKQFEL